MTILVLFVLTLGLIIALKYFAERHGCDVKSRFIERINFIPSQKPALLDRDNLAKWLSDRRNAGAIRAYVFPILFPLDISFLVSLGLLLGFASVAMARSMSFLVSIPAWIWWVLPLSYLAADFVEDTAVSAVFTSKIDLTAGSFRFLKIITKLKLVTVNLALGQVGFLAALYTLLTYFSSTGLY